MPQGQRGAPARRTMLGDDGNQIGAHSALRTRHSALEWLFSCIHFVMDEWGNWRLNCDYMADPITTIVALQKLASNLVESIKDGKDAAKAREILQLIGVLQSEYFTLQQHIIKVEEENSRLKMRLNANDPTAGNKNAAALNLDELHIRMLKHLSSSTVRQTPRMLANALNISVERARHYADTLVDSEYIYKHARWDSAEVKYELDGKGREYLVVHNLDV